MLAERFRGWAPMRFCWRDQHPMVNWCLVDGYFRFTDPFFDQTIATALRNPFQLLFQHQTPIELLGELEQEAPGLAPTGFIFHMSRCGSTLISQMAAVLPDTLVISEAGPIDAVLQARRRNPAVTPEQTSVWLRWMVSTLGRRNDAGLKRYFVKLDAWHILDLELIRKTFPATPWIFVYRDPVEVMVSLMQQPAHWTLPGQLSLELTGMDVASVLSASREEYCGWMLARFLRAALDNYQNHSGLLVNYTELPEIMWNLLGNFFGANFTPAEMELMRASSEFYAKSPTLPFSPDTVDKQRQASERVRQVCRERLQPLYDSLEDCRPRQR
jgi:hypothetical protein